jgi:hypothetical protein
MSNSGNAEGSKAGVKTNPGDRVRLYVKFYASLDTAIRSVSVGRRELIPRPVSYSSSSSYSNPYSSPAANASPLSDILKLLNNSKTLTYTGSRSSGKASADAAFHKAVEGYSKDVREAVKDVSAKYVRYVEVLRKSTSSGNGNAPMVQERDISDARGQLDNMERKAIAFSEGRNTSSRSMSYGSKGYGSNGYGSNGYASEANEVLAKLTQDGPLRRVLGHAFNRRQGALDKHVRDMFSSTGLRASKGDSEYREKHGHLLAMLYEAVDRSADEMANNGFSSTFLDPRKNGLSDLVELSRNALDGRSLPADIEDRRASILLTSTELEAVDVSGASGASGVSSDSILSVATLQQRVAVPLMDVLVDVAKSLSEWSENPSSAQTKDFPVIAAKAVSTVNLIGVLNDRILFNYSDASQPRELNQLVNELDSPHVRRAIVLSREGEGEGGRARISSYVDDVPARVQASKEGLPEGIGSTLFRLLDPSVLDAHLESLYSFKTLVSTESLFDRIPSYKSPPPPPPIPQSTTSLPSTTPLPSTTTSSSVSFPPVPARTPEDFPVPARTPEDFPGSPVDPDDPENEYPRVSETRTAGPVRLSGPDRTTSDSLFPPLPSSLNAQYGGADPGVPGVQGAGAGAGVQGAEDAKKRHESERVKAFKTYVRGMKGATTKFIGEHEEYVRTRGRAAISYVLYWTGVNDSTGSGAEKTKPVPKDVIPMLNEYLRTWKELVTWSKLQIAKEAYRSLEAARRDAKVKEISDLKTVYQIEDEIKGAKAWLSDAGVRLDSIYEQGPPDFLQLALSYSSGRSLVWLYALRGVRLGIAWASVRIGSRTFAGYYQRRMYSPGVDASLSGGPPNPAWMILLILLLDLSMHLIVLTALVASMAAFKSSENEFPIDANLIRAWGTDYAKKSVVVLAVGIALSQVVYVKKYYRYKYEGTRGIFALHDMMFWTYVVFVLL